MALNVLTTDLTGTISVLNADAGQSMLVPVPAASLGGGARTRIVWRDDGSGDAQTWAEVVALIGTTPSVEIYVDQFLVTLAVTPGEVDLFGAWFSAPDPLVQTIGVDIPDGATLRNCGGSTGGIVFVCYAATAPSFVFDVSSLDPFASFFLRLGSRIQNNGTIPAIEVGSGDVLGTAFLLTLETAGGLTPAPAVPTLNATDCVVLVFGLACALGTPLGPNCLSCDATSQIIVTQDGSLTYDPTAWPLWIGAVSESAIGQTGGSGATAYRPGPALFPIPLGCLFYDSDLARNLFWDGVAWQTLDVLGVDASRADQSVNAGRVDNPYSTQPILRAQSSGNVAGGFNGAGVGNKAILGFRPSTVPLPLGSFTDFSFTYTDLLGLSRFPYANVILDLNGTGTAFAVAVIDPGSSPLVLNGTGTLNPDGSRTWAWNAALDNLLIVNGLVGPPNPPGLGFVPPTVVGAPLPAGWLSNSWSVAAILAAYPACTITIADTLDNGLPKSPNPSYPYLLIAGDSNNQLQQAIQLKNVLLNTVPI